MMISVCIYGSVARQRTDELSDRDVLILAPSKEDAFEECSDWQATGWNASFFTYQHFARLVEFQSLFVQHIKLEGRIIRDDKGRLRQYLEKFAPASSYIEDLKDALLPLKWVNPGELCYWARLCVGDILFVATRNAGILHAAGLGRFIYDYGAVVEHLAQAFEFDSAQRAALLALRGIKVAYRARSTGIGVETVLEDAIGALTIVRAAVDRLECEAPKGFVANNYHALRRTELALVKVTDPRELDRLPAEGRLFELWRLICNPSDYPKLRGSGGLVQPILIQPSTRPNAAFF
ncbi:hypothetical protein [Mesorhizobium sp.]|uniref:hypothetical protein n=1 Tax=Mesorhizobium sp. TaxID=1871066 RepID=UPI000FE91705|nr:hypothetical protein [Mesorhizobium sp.]RWA94503.1 MAG: hypothetical protein EOQ32_11695 [Mesorhizobium sp.]